MERSEVYGKKVVGIRILKAQFRVRSNIQTTPLNNIFSFIGKYAIKKNSKYMNFTKCQTPRRLGHPNGRDKRLPQKNMSYQTYFFIYFGEFFL